MKLLETKKIRAKDVKVGMTIVVKFSQDWRQHLQGEDGLLTVDFIDEDEYDGQEYLVFIQKKDGFTFSVEPMDRVEVL